MFSGCAPGTKSGVNVVSMPDGQRWNVVEEIKRHLMRVYATEVAVGGDSEEEDRYIVSSILRYWADGTSLEEPELETPAKIALNHCRKAYYELDGKQVSAKIRLLQWEGI